MEGVNQMKIRPFRGSETGKVYYIEKYLADVSKLLNQTTLWEVDLKYDCQEEFVKTEFKLSKSPRYRNFVCVVNIPYSYIDENRYAEPLLTLFEEYLS